MGEREGDKTLAMKGCAEEESGWNGTLSGQFIPVGTGKRPAALLIKGREEIRTLHSRYQLLYKIRVILSGFPARPVQWTTIKFAL